MQITPADTATPDLAETARSEHPHWAALRAACPLTGITNLDAVTKAVEDAMHLRRRSAGDQIVVDLLAWAVIFRAASQAMRGKRVEAKSGYGRSRLCLGVRMLDAVEANGGVIPTSWMGRGPDGVDDCLRKAARRSSGGRGADKDPGATALVDWMVPPPSMGITTTSAHRPRLSPAEWRRDLEAPDARPELASAGLVELREMVVAALVRLRDRGDWQVVRDEATPLLWDVRAILRDVGGNADSEEPYEDAEQRDHGPRSEEAAREREERRLLGMATEEEANAQTDGDIRLALETATYPPTTEELAETATAWVRSNGGSKVVTSRMVNLCLRGRASRWHRDPKRWTSKHLEALDEDEQVRRAMDAGWNPQTTRSPR